MPPKRKPASNGQNTESWDLAIHKLHIVQGPGIKPSSIRFYPGQRFQLDGDEPVDVESLLRTGAIKIYEAADEEWAQARLAVMPKPKRRLRSG